MDEAERARLLRRIETLRRQAEMCRAEAAIRGPCWRDYKLQSAIADALIETADSDQARLDGSGAADGEPPTTS